MVGWWCPRSAQSLDAKLTALPRVPWVKDPKLRARGLFTRIFVQVLLREPQCRVSLTPFEPDVEVLFPRPLWIGRPTTPLRLRLLRDKGTWVDCAFVSEYRRGTLVVEAPGVAR